MIARILGLAAASVCVLVGCMTEPDDRAVIAERDKPVRRFDSFQAAASNGTWLVGAGRSGVLVKSDDNGTNWVREVLPAPSSLVALSACPNGRFAALDFYRRVWTSDETASNWQANPLEQDFNPLALTCDARGTLWVVGSFATVLSSTDGGKSWIKQPADEDVILTAVQFIDGEFGVVAGEFGTLLVTNDGGNTWSKTPGLPPEFYPYAVMFTDHQTGWVTGVGGSILHTQDGGLTWLPQSNPVGASMFALVSVDGRPLAVGGGGQVLQFRSDAWAPLHAPTTPSDLVAAAASGDGALLVAGASGALGLLALPAPSLASAAEESVP